VRVEIITSFSFLSKSILVTTPTKSQTEMAGTGSRVLAAIALVVALFVVGTEAKAVELDIKTFDDALATASKPHFIMFYAPWCGHCKALKPTWEQLADKVSDKVTIAKVDCDNKDNQPICSKAGIQGFPTLIAYPAGETEVGETYEGGRDLKSLETFTKESMGPACDVATLEFCHDDEKKLIDELKGSTAEEMKEQIEFYEESVKFEDKKFEDFLKSLQEQYEKANAEAKKQKAEHRAKIKILKALGKAAVSSSEL